MRVGDECANFGEPANDENILGTNYHLSNN